MKFYSVINTHSNGGMGNHLTVLASNALNNNDVSEVIVSGMIRYRLYISTRTSKWL